MKTKLFTLLLAVAASVGTMFAEKVQIGDLYYNLDATNKTAEVTSQNSGYPYWSATIATANIPSSVEYNSVTYTVTSIGKWAFCDCTGLTSVTIGNSVTSIGYEAFRRCTALASVTIPNSVTDIGNYAFANCSGLTSVTIGNSVTSIESTAFYNCGISKIHFSGTLQQWCERPWQGTQISLNYSLYIADELVTDLIIPNSSTSVVDGAFSGCTSITSLIIGNNVTSIGDNAFNGCSAMTSVIIGNNVVSIGERAFCGCTALASVTIPNSVTDIGNYAFANCSGLTSVTIGNSVTSIGDYAFSSCSGLTSIEIPNSVTSIEDGTFSGCTGLTSIEIPNSVTNIGSYAFSGCTSLTSVTIPNSVTSIGHSAFSSCTGLKSLKLSKNWIKNDNSNFYICGAVNESNGNLYQPVAYEWTQRLESVEAPAWFFDVDEKNWAYCPKQLETIVVNNGELSDNGVAVISRSYKTLQSLDLSAASNTEMTDEAFKGCYNLQTLKLPTGLTEIGYMAVADCKNLQSIDIPASVTEISQSAFENCRSLKTITFGGSSSPAPGRFEAPAVSASQLQRIGNWAFYNCHELQNLTIPEGVTEIGDGAFYGCTYLEDLTLPSSVHAIGDNTFALCAKMKKIIVNAPVPPTIQAKTFFDVKRQIPVYVPDEVVDAYKDDTYWGEFDIQGVSHMPLGIDDVESGVKAQKLLRDNQVLILRGDKTYTVTGQEVK